MGNFRYQDSGLLDRTHLRWFTRETIIELFNEAGFKIENGKARIFEDLKINPILPIIGEIAKSHGANAEVAMKDSIPFQYVVRAIPS